jgi:hypothetical protein
VEVERGIKSLNSSAMIKAFELCFPNGVSNITYGIDSFLGSSYLGITNINYSELNQRKVMIHSLNQLNL